MALMPWKETEPMTEKERNLKDTHRKEFKGHPQKFLKMLDRRPNGEQEGT